MSELDGSLLAGFDSETPANIGDTTYEWLDGDTIRDEKGHSIRLQGIDTPETSHLRDVTSGVSHETAAGEQAAIEARRMAHSRGFTEVVDSGKKGHYGRAIGDLRNPVSGEMFTDFMIRTGIAKPQPYNSIGVDGQRKMMNYYEAMEERENPTKPVDIEAEAARKRIEKANYDQSLLNGHTILKETAFDEREFAMEPDAYSGVAIRSLDRNMNNEAYDQWTTSFDTALIGVSSAYHGFRQLLGAMTDNEILEKKGSAGVQRANYRISLNPTTTLDMDDVDGVGDFVDYLANNAAMSVPYMATTIGGGIAGAAVGTMAAPVVGTVGGAVLGATAGLSAPTAIYAGQVYNEQEVKDEKIALASGFLQATLDRVGLKGFSSAGKTLKGTLGDAQMALVKQGMTKAAAKSKLMGAGRKEIMLYMDDAAKFAKKQISARNITREVISSAGKGMGTEAVTEALQEAVAYAGANHHLPYMGVVEEGRISDKMIERMGKAAMAGGLLGGTFGTAGASMNRLGWADEHYNLSDDSKRRTRADNWNEEARAEGMDDNDTYLDKMVKTKGDPTDSALRTSGHIERRKNKSLIDRSMSTLFQSYRLWRGQMRSNFSIETLDKSKTARRMADMYGGTLNRIFPGRTYEGAKHLNYANYVTESGNPRLTVKGYKGIKRDKKAQEAFSKDYYRIAAMKVKHDEAQWKKKKKDRTEWDWSGTTTAERNTFDKVFQDVERTAQKMFKAQNKSWMSGIVGAKPKFKQMQNYLLKHKEMDKDRLQVHRGRFVKLLGDHYKMKPKTANELVTKILEGQGMDGVDDGVFSLLTQGYHPGAAKKRTLALSEHPEFAEFFSQDFVKNTTASMRSAARFQTYYDFVGQDKWKLNQQLQEMADEGVDQSVIDELAYNMERYFESESGNYKRPAIGSSGHKALAIQKSVLFYSLITALPLSALSSFVELAMTMKAMNEQQIYGKDGLGMLGKEMARMFGRGMYRCTDDLFMGHARLDKSAVGVLLETLGYNEQEVGAATTTGATEINSGWKKTWVENFFKYNGLQGLTNTTRAIRASMANDFIMNHLEIISEYKDLPINHVRQSRQQLLDLGLDADKLLEMIEKDKNSISQFALGDEKDVTTGLSQKDQEYLKKAMDLGTFNFINDAVALPGAANRPLIYSDPRFAMFTQFNGFISTLQATILPKMWGDYVLRGSPMMKYNTFIMMGTMIAIGFASQYLKDIIKNGTAKTDLSSAEKLRRAVNSSGLLGVSERALGIIYPMYKQPKYKNVLEKTFSTVAGEAPALSPIGRMADASSALYEGDMEKASYNALRAAPGLGPATGLTKFISRKVFGDDD